jgi:nucleobase:cation symporter-1, NCS1 family
VTDALDLKDAVSHDVKPEFAFEHRGFDFIPERDRYMRPSDLTLFWVGLNLNLFFFIVGGVTVSLGLALWQALAAVLIGNALFVIVAYSSIGGPRSGLPTMTFSRAAFGVLGNRANAFLAWVTAVAFEIINAIIGVFAVLAIFSELGWSDPGNAGKVVAALIVLVLCIAIAVLGHAVMTWAQRIFAVSIGAVMVLLFFWTLADVDWSYDSAQGVSGGALFGLFLIACAVVASGPLSYLFNCCDWSRYLPTQTPTKTIFWVVMAGAFIPAIFLGLMGALIATSGADVAADPVAALKGLVPTWLFVLFAISAVGGSISNNAPTLYASGLSLQALGVPLRRWVATAIDGVTSTAILLYILIVEDFTVTLLNFLALLNVWIGPFGAIWLVDGLLRRWRYDPIGIHTSSPASPYWYRGGVNLHGFVALALGMAVGLLTINATWVHGPLSDVFWDGDIAWLAPPLVAAITYWILAAGSVRTAGTPSDAE